MTCKQIVNLLKTYPGLNDLKLPYACVSNSTYPKRGVVYSVYGQHGFRDSVLYSSAHSLLEYTSRNPEKQVLKKLASGINEMLLCRVIGAAKTLDHSKLYNVRATAKGLCEVLGVPFEGLFYPVTPLLGGEYPEDEFRVLTSSDFYASQEFRVRQDGSLDVHLSSCQFNIIDLERAMRTRAESIILTGDDRVTKEKYDQLLSDLLKELAEQRKLAEAMLKHQAKLKQDHAQFFRFE